ncbi:MAG: YlbE-like family protein [Turicibacter sp.]
METMYKIVNNVEHRDYIRMNPFWYKELNRNPEKYEEFSSEIETMKKQQQPSKLKQFETQLAFAQMMLRMFNNK